jgi:hypothetical protein
LPVGILTHHLDHTAAVWERTEAMLVLFTSHPAVRFLPVDAVL